METNESTTANTYNVADLAAHYNVRQDTIRRWARNGVIAFTRVGIGTVGPMSFTGAEVERLDRTYRFKR